MRSHADGTGGSGHRVMVVAGMNSAGGAWDSPTVGIDVKALGYYRDEREIRYFSYAADGGVYTKADTLGDRSVVRRLFEDRVFGELLLDLVDQLELGHLQELDRLLERRRHDEPLAHPHAESLL